VPVLSHRIALDPTPTQRIALARAAGCSRVAYNWGLAAWRSEYEAHKVDPTRPSPRFSTLLARWSREKHALFPWMKESPKDANILALWDLDTAFKKFFQKTARYPRFKQKGRNAPSFGLSNDKFRIEGRRARLPVIGWIRAHESLRFEGKILSGRITKTADRWFLSVTVEAAHARPTAPANTVIGIDLGVNVLATTFDGSTVGEITNPRALRSAARRLHRAQLAVRRKKRARDKRLGAPKKGERRPPGQNLIKAQAKVARIHARVANVRRDAIHKATTRIARSYATVVIEDLAVRNMTRRARGRGRAAKAGLNRAILDAGFGEFRRQLTYKIPLHGGDLRATDRFYPSSKTCCACGLVKKTLQLSERTFTCDSCGHVVPRDENASRNLYTLGARGIHACGGDIRPRDLRDRAAVPVETGIAGRLCEEFKVRSS